MSNSSERKAAFENMVQEDAELRRRGRGGGAAKGFGSGSDKRKRLIEAQQGPEEPIAPEETTAADEADRASERTTAPSSGEDFKTPNYHGNSIYEKADGRLVKKVGVDLRLDQVEALERAIASAKLGSPDPHGKDRGEIIRRLLDEAGFNAGYRPPGRRR